MSKGIEERAKFDKIRYANCWEDPELLIEVFEMGGKYISIASAGDNSLSLLTKNPELVYTVDLSIPQIACCELKKYAVKNLDYETFLTAENIIDSIILGIDNDFSDLEKAKYLF